MWPLGLGGSDHRQHLSDKSTAYCAAAKTWFGVSRKSENSLPGYIWGRSRDEVRNNNFPDNLEFDPLPQNVRGIFTNSNGAITKIADNRGNFTSFDGAPDINNSGTLTFSPGLSAGDSKRLFRSTVNSLL